MVQGSSRESFFLLFWPFWFCLFVIFCSISFFFTCWLVSIYSYYCPITALGGVAIKHISSYLLFVHMLTAIFFSKGPKGYDGFRGMKGSKV